MESVDPMGFCGGQVSGIPDFAYALLESLPEVQSFSNGSYLVPWKMSDFQQKTSNWLMPKRSQVSMDLHATNLRNRWIDRAGCSSSQKYFNLCKCSGRKGQPQTLQSFRGSLGS